MGPLHAQAAQAVLQGDTDIGLGFAVQRHEGLRQCALGHFPLGAIAHPEHPIARLDRVDFVTCASFPLILPTPELSMHSLLQPVINHYHHDKRSLHVVLETASIELAKQLAERGIGLFFQSRLGLERELCEGRLVHVLLDTPIPTISELGLYVRAGRSLPPALDALIRIATDAIAQRENTTDRKPVFER